MKLFELTFDENNIEEGLLCISIVSDPAISKNFLCFSEEKEHLTFNEEEHKIFGPVLVPFQKIYRYRPGFGEYEVFFSDLTIKKLVEKYSSLDMFNITDEEHNGEQSKTQAICTQSFLKDTTKGINPVGFEDCPDSTWFMEFHITDDELWTKIKSGELKGFSVECVMNMIDKFASEPKEESFESWLDRLTFSVDMGDVIDIVVNHKVVMISTYDDEKPSPALGRRQVIFVACGLSKAGNEVVRALQYYGPHRELGHDWELLRLDRIQSMRVMNEIEPWDLEDLDLNELLEINLYGDKSMSAVFATSY